MDYKKLHMKKFRAIILLLLVYVQACNKTASLEPIGPLPSERQLAWHELEYYAFVHFNMNTFTNMEWGTGAENQYSSFPWSREGGHDGTVRVGRVELWITKHCI